MTEIRAKILVGPDRRISGTAPEEIPPGEHEVIIAVLVPAQRTSESEIFSRVRALQEEVARLPVLDPRDPDEILGYNQIGAFD